MFYLGFAMGFIIGVVTALIFAAKVLIPSIILKLEKEQYINLLKAPNGRYKDAFTYNKNQVINRVKENMQDGQNRR